MPASGCSSMARDALDSSQKHSRQLVKHLKRLCVTNSSPPSNAFPCSVACYAKISSFRVLLKLFCCLLLVGFRIWIVSSSLPTAMLPSAR